MTDVYKLSHSVDSLHYHFVLVTKYRAKCLTAPMFDRLKVLSAEAAAAGHLDGVLSAAGIASLWRCWQALGFCVCADQFQSYLV